MNYDEWKLQASPLDEIQEAEYNPKDDFYFIDKMESFWDRIDYDLMNEINTR